MLETDLQNLARQIPDHPLESLDGDIWAKVAAVESARSLSRLIAASQAFVLVFALIGSAAAGVHWSAAGPRDDLGVFSPRSPWAAAIRLDGSSPP